MTIEEIQAELQEEIDLCNKYFIEEDICKESTEHERLALKIVMMCMQTLSALKDGELEDYKHVKQWKSDVIDSFCKYDASSLEELVTNVRNKAIDDFANGISECLGVENATKYGNKNAEQQRMSYETLMKYEIADAIEDIAEHLKAGDVE